MPLYKISRDYQEITLTEDEMLAIYYDVAVNHIKDSVISNVCRLFDLSEISSDELIKLIENIDSIFNYCINTFKYDDEKMKEAVNCVLKSIRRGLI